MIPVKWLITSGNKVIYLHQWSRSKLTNLYNCEHWWIFKNPHNEYVVEKWRIITLSFYNQAPFCFVAMLPLILLSCSVYIRSLENDGYLLCFLYGFLDVNLLHTSTIKTSGVLFTSGGFSMHMSINSEWSHKHLILTSNWCHWDKQNPFGTGPYNNHLDCGNWPSK